VFLKWSVFAGSAVEAPGLSFPQRPQRHYYFPLVSVIPTVAPASAAEWRGLLFVATPKHPVTLSCQVLLARVLET